MNYFLCKTRLIISTFALSIVLLVVACDRHKNEKADEIILINISDDTATYFVEKHTKRGIEISEEEQQEISAISIKEGILNDKD